MAAKPVLVDQPTEVENAYAEPDVVVSPVEVPSYDDIQAARELSIYPRCKESYSAEVGERLVRFGLAQLVDGGYIRGNYWNKLVGS
jgi:hypothetical protein